MADRHSEPYRWRVLALGTLTFTFVVAIPNMSLPVLFDEIATELGLSLVQVGWIWGIGSVMGIFVGLIGGPIGDRFGPRITLTFACLLIGLAGGARALSTNFTMLAITAFLTGAAQWTIPMNVHKTCGLWFSKKQLGMANGVVATGMALGFMLGAFTAATYLSPLLGGWRSVLLVYGLIAIVFSVLWFLTQEHSSGTEEAPADRIRPAAAIRQVLALPQVWLICLGTAAVAGGINGTLGFLALHLRGLDWTASRADQTLALFHAASLVFAVLLAIYSDRSGQRVRVLMICVLLSGISIALIGVASVALLPVAVLLAGVTRDGYMAITMTTLTEVKGVGPGLAGTAIGLNMTIMGLSNTLAPPIGNSLAQWGSGIPFYFWSGLILLALVPYLLLRRRAVTSSP